MSGSQNIKGEHLFLLLFKASKAVQAYDNKSIKELGFSNLSDFIVLEALLHKGPLPVNTLGKKLMLTSGSVTTAIDRAEKRGYVRRDKSPEDGRIVLACLTDKGKKFICGSYQSHAAQLERLFTVLTKEERIELARLLKKIGKTAEAINL